MTLAINLAQALIPHTSLVPQKKEEEKSPKAFGGSIRIESFPDEGFDNSTVVDNSMLKQILNRTTEEHLSSEIDRILIEYGQEDWDGEEHWLLLHKPQM